METATSLQILAFCVSLITSIFTTSWLVIELMEDHWKSAFFLLIAVTILAVNMTAIATIP